MPLESSHMETGTAIIFVVQALIGIVVMTAIPFAFSISSRISKIEVTLSTLVRDLKTKTDTSHIVHDDLYTQLHSVRRTLDRCPSCRDAVKSMNGSDS